MNTKNKEGFTIIEVVLVLAIAGLIFMMVFIALPALQRSQRDTQRKNDVSRAITAVNNYSSANRGLSPFADLATYTADQFTKDYLLTDGDQWVDPSGATGTQPDYYVLTLRALADAAPSGFSASQNVVFFTPAATCNTGGTVKAAGNRKVALRIVLEGGGVYCVNN